MWRRGGSECQLPGSSMTRQLPCSLHGRGGGGQATLNVCEQIPEMTDKGLRSLRPEAHNALLVMQEHGRHTTHCRRCRSMAGTQSTTNHAGAGQAHDALQATQEHSRHTRTHMHNHKHTHPRTLSDLHNDAWLMIYL